MSWESISYFFLFTCIYDSVTVTYEVPIIYPSCLNLHFLFLVWHFPFSHTDIISYVLWSCWQHSFLTELQENLKRKRSVGKKILIQHYSGIRKVLYKLYLRKIWKTNIGNHSLFRYKSQCSWFGSAFLFTWWIFTWIY